MQGSLWCPIVRHNSLVGHSAVNERKKQRAAGEDVGEGEQGSHIP